MQLKLAIDSDSDESVDVIDTSSCSSSSESRIVMKQTYKANKHHNMPTLAGIVNTSNNSCLTY